MIRVTKLTQVSLRLSLATLPSAEAAPDNARERRELLAIVLGHEGEAADLGSYSVVL